MYAAEVEYIDWKTYLIYREKLKAFLVRMSQQKIKGRVKELQYEK